MPSCPTLAGGARDQTQNHNQNRRPRRGDAPSKPAGWLADSGARPNVSFQVLADNEVKESELRQSNLVLFGTKESNSLIARYAAALPLELKSEAPGVEDYGLLFVAPIEGRPALICSGLSWWASGEKAGRASFRWQWMSLPYRLLLSFGDYIVYKGSIENVIAEGRFDREWRTPAPQAAKLRATDAVNVR